METTILIVDDEQEIADLLEIYLKNEGYQVLKYYNGTDALEAVQTQKIDLAILDVMLPDITGFDLCKKIRESHYYPIIMLTAKGEDRDIVMGLTLGADDYITKPFKPIEIVARVRTQLRRYKNYNTQASAKASQEIEIRGLIINKDTHKVVLYNEELDLTPIEFSLLYYLCSNQGRVVTSEELFEAVWNAPFIDGNNTIMTHVGRLREKMHETARKPKFIKTVWGVGYTVE